MECLYFLRCVSVHIYCYDHAWCADQENIICLIQGCVLLYISKIIILCTVDTFQITPVRRCWWWWDLCHPVILETSSTPSMYVRERKIISKMAFPLPIQHTVVLLWTIAGVHHAIEYLRWWVFFYLLPQELVKQSVRCSVVGLAAEVRLCKTITQKTGGMSA